jgi:hypothetical protein
MAMSRADDARHVRDPELQMWLRDLHALHDITEARRRAPRESPEWRRLLAEEEDLLHRIRVWLAT